MKKLPIPLETINKVLDREPLIVHDPYNLGAYNFPGLDDLVVKPKIKGWVNKISIGEPTDFLSYDAEIILDEKNLAYHPEVVTQVLDTLVHPSRKYSTRFERELDRLLQKILLFLGIDTPVLLDNLTYKVPKKMNENLVIEGKYDNVTRTMVRDIINIFKKNKEGDFKLPEELRQDEHTYELNRIGHPVGINLYLRTDDDVDTFDVEGHYYHGEDIDIVIVTNPNMDQSKLWDLVGELNEVIRHELEHMKQYESGYKFPPEPSDPMKYYTQKHEIGAQKAGFKRKSKIQKNDFETLVRKWFEQNPHKHRLNPKQVEKVIKKVIEDV